MDEVICQDVQCRLEEPMLDPSLKRLVRLPQSVDDLVVHCLSTIAYTQSVVEERRKKKELT